VLTVSDRLDILETVTRADNAATLRDTETYISFFTDDAILDGEKGEYRGKEQLRDSVDPIWKSEGTSSTHVTVNAVVDGVESDPDRALVTSVLLILRNETMSVLSLSFITQHLVRVHSQWLIERRSVQSAAGTSHGR
jgi:hypothetical protein